MEDKLIIKGQFWSAGDNVFIDHPDNDGAWICTCLNELMKRHIPDNSMLEIEITIKEPERRVTNGHS